MMIIWGGTEPGDKCRRYGCLIGEAYIMGIFSVPTGCVNGQLVTEKLTLGRLLAASSLLATFKRSRSHLSSSS